MGKKHHLRGLLLFRCHRFNDAADTCPQFEPSTDEEHEEWEKAKTIRENMLAQKAKRNA